MKVITGAEQRRPGLSLAVVLGSIGLLAVSIFTETSVKTTAPIIGVVVVIVMAYRTLLSWRWLIGALVLVILFIPIKRYSLPASLPFNLEPYRLLVAFVAIGWGTSLLIDPRVRFKRTGVDAALMCFLFAVLIGLVVNSNRVSVVSGEVYKKLAFFASFFIIIYLIASVLRHARDIELIVTLLTVGGAILAIFAVIERRTNYNVFNHLQTVLPFLHLNRSQHSDRPLRRNWTTSGVCVSAALDCPWRSFRHAVSACPLPCTFARTIDLVGHGAPTRHGGSFNRFAYGSRDARGRMHRLRLA